MNGAGPSRAARHGSHKPIALLGRTAARPDDVRPSFTHGPFANDITAARA